MDLGKLKHLNMMLQISSIFTLNTFLKASILGLFLQCISYLVQSELVPVKSAAVSLPLNHPTDVFAVTMGMHGCSSSTMLWASIVKLHVHINRDAGRSKLLSWGTHCDHCKTPLSTYIQEKFCRALLSVIIFCCASTACGSFAYFKLVRYRFQLNENAKMLCLYCTIQKVQIFV